MLSYLWFQGSTLELGVEIESNGSKEDHAAKIIESLKLQQHGYKFLLMTTIMPLSCESRRHSNLSLFFVLYFCEDTSHTCQFKFILVMTQEGLVFRAANAPQAS